VPLEVHRTTSRTAVILLLACSLLLAADAGPARAGDRSILPPSAAPCAVAAPQEAYYLVDSSLNGPDDNAGDGHCATSGGACTLRAASDQWDTTYLLDNGGDGIYLARGSG
jgi:hypothetical protein